MDESLKLKVWNKGTTIPEYDAAKWRRDACGNAISFAAYGNRSSDYGWEIDHITPVTDEGSDALGNLRPLHWRVNASRQ